MDPILSAGLTLVSVIVVIGVGFFILSGASMERVGLGLRTLLRTLSNEAFAAQVKPLLTPPPPQEQKPPKPSGAPLRLLTLLQREGRLLDFLLEDIQAYDDAQVGASARDIQRKCQAALKEHLVLEAVMPQDEGAAVEVPVGFDPSAIRLTGNVTGQPPFRGTLQHHGWRVKEMKLAAPPEGQDEFVVATAEVELP